MQPSSLIFLVIIGVWAAFLVQHWVWRREDLRTARSIDAFSESMRVLRRRDPLPSSEVTRPSYAVSPLRAARPQVTLERAEPAMAMASDGPASSSGSSGSSPWSGSPGPMPREADVAVEAPYRMRPARATRGITLLAFLAATPVFGVLSAVGVLRWWAFLVPLVASIAAFFWLRSGVQAEIHAKRAARAAARRRERDLARPARPATTRHAFEAPTPAAERVQRETARTERSAPAARVERDLQDDVVEATPAPAATAQVDDQPVDVGVSADAPYDIAEATAQEPAQPAPAAAPAPAARAAYAVDEDDIPLTWDPRPVPPPTYTLKAPARRPEPAPAQPVVEPEIAVEDDGYGPPRIVNS